MSADSDSVRRRTTIWDRFSARMKRIGKQAGDTGKHAEEAVLRVVPRPVREFLSRHASVKQAVKTALSNNITLLADMIVLFLLTEFTGLHYLISSAAGFLVGTTIGYFISTGWIFRRKAGTELPPFRYPLFLLTAGVGLLIIQSMMYFFTDLVGLHYMMSRLFAGWVVFLWDFLARKYIVFRKAPEKER